MAKIDIETFINADIQTVFDLSRDIDLHHISPFGIIGRIFNLIFLKNYLEKFLIERNNFITNISEKEQLK